MQGAWGTSCPPLTRQRRSLRPQRSREGRVQGGFSCSLLEKWKGVVSAGQGTCVLLLPRCTCHPLP